MVGATDRGAPLGPRPPRCPPAPRRSETRRNAGLRGKGDICLRLPEVKTLELAQAASDATVRELRAALAQAELGRIFTIIKLILTHIFSIIVCMISVACL